MKNLKSIARVALRGKPFEVYNLLHKAPHLTKFGVYALGSSIK